MTLLNQPIETNKKYDQADGKTDLCILGRLALLFSNSCWYCRR